jgi:hypothetical protein
VLVDNIYMPSTIKEILFQSAVLAVIFLGALAVVQSTQAWNPPGQGPTGGNATPFLHTGSTNQVKDGPLGVEDLILDQLCIGADCKTGLGVPNCQVCIAAGTANGPLAAEQCVPFDGSTAFSGREDGSNGRGTHLTVRVVCP